MLFLKSSSSVGNIHTWGGILYTNASCFMRRVLSGPPGLSPGVGAAAPPPLAGMGGGAEPAGLGLLNGLAILVCKLKMFVSFLGN